MLMYLINTIAFKDDWKDQFSGSDTRESVFYGGEQEKTTASFMNQEKQFSYLEGGDAFQFIVLPYATDRFAFVALLPDKSMPIRSYLAEYEDQPFSEMLFDWVEKSEKTLVKLSLPKFESRYKESLVSSLKTLGMKRAFSPGVADFSAMLKEGREPLHIDEVLHKSFIRVDEEGTEAAAVTAVMIRVTSFMPRESVEMRLNRPFFYAILDMEKEIPLFMGILDTPRNFCCESLIATVHSLQRGRVSSPCLRDVLNWGVRYRRSWGGKPVLYHYWFLSTLLLYRYFIPRSCPRRNSLDDWKNMGRHH